MALLTLTTCTVDLQRGEVYRDGSTTRLTPKERQLLTHLASRPGEYVARATLLEQVWGYAAGTRTHTLATNVYTLRQKLERDPSNPTHLLARWGRGYCLEVPEEVTPPSSKGAESSWVERPVLEATVVDRLQQGSVSLIGPPGAGKSRLAIQVARRLELPGGASMVRLESVSSQDQLATAVLRALQQSPRHASTWRDHLASVLDERGQTLLVADDVDGLTDDAHEALLATSSVGLVLLTTGRRRRPGLPVIEVPPLDGPPPNALPAEVLESPAARLLAARADLGLSESSADAVRKLVDATGGLPLALELAAAQLRAATLEEVADHASRHGGRGLDAVLERSWADLEEPEQDVLAHCAWFHGWFSLGDASAVLGRPALESLVSLADHSLLQRRTHGSRSRYRMLPPVRRFCRARVAARDGWRDHIERQHEAAMASVAERMPWADRSVAPTSERTLLLDDLDAARRRARDRGDLARAGQITAAWVSTQLVIRDPDIHLADLADQTARETPEGPVRARLHCLAAEAAGRLNDYDRVTRALSAAKQAGATHQEYQVAFVRSSIWKGDSDALLGALDELTETLHPVEIAQLRARVARRNNQRDEQLYLAESALGELDGRARPTDELWLHVFLGDALFASVGSASEALAHYEAALHISQKLPGDHGRAAVHHLRAVAYGRLSKFDEAIESHEAAAGIMRRLGQRARRMYYQLQLANTLVLGSRELDRAGRLVDEGLRYFDRGNGHPLDVEVARSIAAEIALIEGRPMDCIELARTARSALSDRPDGPMLADTYILEAQARIRLGEDAWADMDRGVELYHASQLLPAWLNARAIRTRLTAEAGDPEAAHRELAWLRDYLDTHPRVDIGASFDLDSIERILANR